MKSNQNKNVTDNGKESSKNPVDIENNVITLIDGRTLQCFPKVEISQPIDNRMRLDTSGEYLSVGRKKAVEQPTSPDVDQAKKFFTDHAFFFLDHREQILRDSRMFLAPVPVQSGLAYTGTSGFCRPTLGVYIEWWMRCALAIIGRNPKSSWLVYRIAGSPLSGSNSCGIVNQKGECLSEPVPGRFSDLWSSFVEINTRYDAAKERYEAYSLEEVAEQLKANDNGDSLTERMVYLLQRENVILRQELNSTKEANAKSFENMRYSLLRAYLECKRDVLEEWYADYCRRQEEGERKLADLKLQTQQLKHQLRTGEITNVFYQRQLTPIKKKIVALQLYLKNENLSDILPDVVVSLQEVIDFLNGKLGVSVSGLK